MTITSAALSSLFRRFKPWQIEKLVELKNSLLEQAEKMSQTTYIREDGEEGEARDWQCKTMVPAVKYYRKAVEALLKKMSEIENFINSRNRLGSESGFQNFVV